jgi:hypothetical protein
VEEKVDDLFSLFPEVVLYSYELPDKFGLQPLPRR